jgi:MinD-like ATPase involved in chromosome partitioning or flagellar assembly
MTVLAFTAAKGAPGVTTSVLALAAMWSQAWPGRRVLVVDADPAGSGVRPGLLRDDVGDGVFALAAVRGGDPVAAVWQRLVAWDGDGRVLLLPGATDGSAAGALATAWETVGAAVRALRRDPDLDVLLDLGRAGHRHQPDGLLALADRVLVVTGSTLVGLAPVPALLRHLTDRGATVGGLVVGPDRPYTTAEIARAVPAPVVGCLPHDPATADALLAGGMPGGWRFTRSPLARAARGVASGLHTPDPARSAAPPPGQPLPAGEGVHGDA